MLIFTRIRNTGMFNPYNSLCALLIFDPLSKLYDESLTMLLGSLLASFQYTMSQVNSYIGQI